MYLLHFWWFVLLQKLFSFSRKSKFRILDIQISWRYQMPEHKKYILLNNLGCKNFLLIWSFCVILQKKKNYQRILQKLQPENLFQALLCLQRTQQTFILKTSWRDAFRLHLQKTSSRRLDQDEYICLSHLSSEDVFKTSWSYVFKMFSRGLVQTSSRYLQDVLQICLQDIFKRYH